MSQTAPSQHDDIRDLISTIVEDRAAAKHKERRESWTRYVSLMIVALAVATAIGSLKAGGYSGKVLLNQSLASDAWSYYQAKSIKRNIAEMEGRMGAPEAQATAKAQVERYRGEEAEIKKRAEDLERERDVAAKHGPPLGFGIASLQIAIALASVCLITKRRLLWGVSGALGVLGASYVIYGLYFV